MTKLIYCHKLKKQALAMSFAPMPGDLGQKLLDQISESAWDLWLQRQTMLINEYRLNLTDKASRDFLCAEMEKFLFGEDSEPPPGYQDEKQ